MLPHLLDFVYIGALVAPILSGAIGSINDATTCAQLGEIFAGFGKRGNELSSPSQTRFIVGVGHGGYGLPS